MTDDNKPDFYYLQDSHIPGSVPQGIDFYRLPRVMALGISPTAPEILRARFEGPDVNDPDYDFEQDPDNGYDPDFEAQFPPDETEDFGPHGWCDRCNTTFEPITNFEGSGPIIGELCTCGHELHIY